MYDLQSRLGDFVRAARQQADMSQRELAKASRVGRSTIADLESGQMINPQLFTLLYIAAVVRWHVVFVTAEGRPVAPYDGGVAMDSAGRELPVHLDVHVRPEPNFWWQRRGGHTFYRDRALRDEMRNEHGRDGGPSFSATRIA